MQPRFVHAPPEQCLCVACGQPLELRSITAASPTANAAGHTDGAVRLEVRCRDCGFVNVLRLTLTPLKPWQDADPLVGWLSQRADASVHNELRADAIRNAEFCARYWAEIHRLLLRAELSHCGERPSAIPENPCEYH